MIQHGQVLASEEQECDDDIDDLLPTKHAHHSISKASHISYMHTVICSWDNITVLYTSNLSVLPLHPLLATPTANIWQRMANHWRTSRQSTHCQLWETTSCHTEMPLSQTKKNIFPHKRKNPDFYWVDIQQRHCLLEGLTTTTVSRAWQVLNFL